MKIEGLSTLLECLREEVDSWELDPPPQDPRLIRYGLYLTAMDILLAEIKAPGGYESYIALQTEGRLPEADYDMFRSQLAPFIEWFTQLYFKRVASLTNLGLSEEEAQSQVLSIDAPVIDTWLESLTIKNF